MLTTRSRAPEGQAPPSIKTGLHRAPLLPLALCVLSSACLDPTSLIVTVTTDVPCGRAAGVSVTVGAPGEVEAAEPAVITTDCVDGTIGGLTVVPQGSRSASVALRVAMAVGGDVERDCTPARGYAGCIVSRRQLRFLPQRTVRVPVELRASCRDVPCDAETTCFLSGQCVAAGIAAPTCAGTDCVAELPGDGPTAPPDAGMDAGWLDAGVDAGAEDAGAPTPCAAVSCQTGFACEDGGCVELACLGAQCPPEAPCLRGRCVAPCVANLACGLDSPCQLGVTACPADGGEASCEFSRFEAAGTPCPEGVCSGAGVCNACQPDQPCSTGNPCDVNRTSCSSGTSNCSPIARLDAGAPCGAGAVCTAAGLCAPCNAGGACSTGAICERAAIDCSTGSPRCLRLGPAPAGNLCDGSAMGQCVACQQGQPCTPGPCRRGGLSCLTGTPQCQDLGAVPAGTACGTNSV
ncbi:MAG: hypothetical protein INH37_24625, partial [Myxococcaceae bacterium]|nr:hypothetical protein [Myxococcaceae bacterium]